MKATEQIRKNSIVEPNGIPQGWQECKLSAVSQKISVGLAISVTEYFRSEGVPLLRNQNIGDGFLNDSSLIFISTEFDSKNKSKRVKEGDVLITRTGAKIGSACVVPLKYEGAQTFTTLIVRPSKELLPQYLVYHILSKGLSEVERLSAGGGKPNLNAGFLKKYRIALPTTEEQQAIAKLLATWDDAIVKTQALIAQKKLRKKWLLANLLTGKKRLKGFDDEWKEHHLGDMFTERVETDFHNLPLLSVGQGGVYPQSESDKKDTSNEDKSNYKRICPGDIGYNTMRMWQGRSALSKQEGIVSPAYTIVTPRQNADSLFFSYLFKTRRLTNLFWRNSQGLVDDTLNCKFKDFRIVRTLLPKREEQAAIAKVMVAAENEIELLTQELDQLKEQKKGLMQQLLTGKKRLTLNQKQN